MTKINNRNFRIGVMSTLISFATLTAYAHDTGVPHEESENRGNKVEIKAGELKPDMRSGRDKAPMLATGTTGNIDIDNKIRAINDEFAVKLKALVTEYQAKLSAVAGDNKTVLKMPAIPAMNIRSSSTSSSSIKDNNEDRGHSEDHRGDGTPEDRPMSRIMSSSTASSTVKGVSDFIRGIFNIFRK